VQIRNFETRIGVALFERTSRGMQLTEAGQALLVRAREALTLAQDGVEAARGVAAGRRGRLTIGYMFALGYAMLPRLVPALRRALPEVELQFVEMSARVHEPWLLEHRVNVALCMPPVRHDEIETELVGAYPLRVAVPASSPLAALRSVPVSRLEGERLIGLPAGPGGPESSIVSAVLRRHQVHVQLAHRVETVHAALALVLAGEGVAILPGCVAPLCPKAVVLRPLLRVPDRLDVAVCWRREAKLSAGAAVVAAARECFRGQGRGAPVS
jgi:DNA-binding transcriptional LysR family regulator